MATPEKQTKSEETFTNMDPPKATPKNAVTVSRTAGPTPQNKDRWRGPAHFMSPTDALVSPCTQKLMNKRSEQGKPMKPRGKMIQSISKPSKSKLEVSNKENQEREVKKETDKPSSVKV
ncbi:uncharacterized protein [Dysidea avara]|uniref:uncharacterized protein n=1 Tax=Dysidea avara TaxID=196820 RepID=UPI00332ED7CF